MNHGRCFPYLPALQSPGVPDVELLARWVGHRDEAAFELIVRRHAPTVRAACQRLLADPNDADDVAQAVFLVLARKAASVARGEVLAAWLHRVACRAALRIRADRVKRASRQESGGVDQLPSRPLADPAWPELLRVLDEEVERLPARHRAAFVLCCLEGKTGEEAGRLLGCPPGTVSSRLTRARERLRNRLTRRGFAPAALLLAALTSDALAVTVPNTLIECVVRAAPLFAGGCAHGGSPSRSTTIAETIARTMTMNRFKLVPALLVIGLLAAGAVLAGSGSDRAAAPTPRQPDPKVAADEKRLPDQKQPPGPLVARYKLIHPQPGGVDFTWVQPAIADAGRQVHLLPPTAGVLKRVEVDLGDRVKAGQLLAEIDAPALALDERQAAVGVEQVQGLLKEAEARVVVAKAELGAAKGAVRVREVEASGAKATLDIRKKSYERLKESGLAVSQADLAEAEGQYRTAQAQAGTAELGVENARTDLSVKEAKLVQVEAGVATARANVESARLGVEKARLALAQTRITAPFDGVVARRGYHPGDFVRPGERADPTPLFTVLNPNVLRLVVWVPEDAIARVEPGQAVEVTFAALPGKKVAGKIARMGFAVEQPHRTVRAEIDLPNPKGDIRPGMSAVVDLKFGKAPAGVLRVPAGAVVRLARGWGEPETAVYIYKDGKARLTRVRVGFADEKEREVLSGLAAEDLVVADPKDLAPKAEVEVEVEKPAPPK